MSLEEHRKGIDAIDKKLVKLLNERTEHALAIGAIKLKAGEEIYAPHRERLIFQRLAKLNKGPVPDEAMQAIYREIMSCSLSLEKSSPSPTRPGGDQHIRPPSASLATARYAPQKTIKDVFRWEKTGPTTAWCRSRIQPRAVTHTLDLFVESPLKSSLVVMRSSTAWNNCRSKVRKLYRIRRRWHSVVFGCNKTSPRWKSLRCPPPHVPPKWPQRTKPQPPSPGHSLRSVTTCRSWITTFKTTPRTPHAFSFSAASAVPPPRTTALALSWIEDKVGALHQVMEPFRKHRLNMTKIESRPSKRKAWE